MHPRVLKELSIVLSKPLYMLFKQSLQQGRIPASWKEAYRSPIFKKGSKSTPANYRPVSLMSVLCKLQESLVRHKLMSHMMNNNFLSECQHGFINGRSCSTQLLAVLEIWTKILDVSSKHCVDAIYLDFAKAFDTIPHNRLMLKLRSYGVT